MLEISKMRLRSGGVAMRGRITTQSLRSLDDRGRPLVLHKEEVGCAEAMCLNNSERFDSIYGDFYGILRN